VEVSEGILISKKKEAKHMEKKSKKELVKKGSETKVTVHIGKEGVTEGIVEEIKIQIRNSRLVKVRVLPAADMDKDKVAADLEARTGAKCVETRGFTILLCAPKLHQ
jgi:RNA-binding protein